jgi:hypothetical protein
LTQLTTEQKSEYLARRRAKYASDPEEREKRKANAKKWRLANPERRREVNRAWEANNAEKSTASKRAWKERNYDAARASDRANYIANREQRIASQRHKRTGFTPDLFQQTLEAQGHKCAICEDDLLGKPSRHVHADHCHDSGKPRGILCNGCNAGIGFFRDDEARLRSAIQYLKSHAEG